MFLCEFCQIFRTSSWQSTSRRLPHVFTSEFWEIFQNTLFIEHLQKSAYIIYKLQSFNQYMQLKTISQMLFKHFVQKRELTIRRRSFT